jgi:Gamma-glutamyl cyclotransferase, AIG2-like
MTRPRSPKEFLFSYGTLQLESVQLHTFGRKLSGTPDVLPGFEQTMVEIDDPDVVAASGKTLHPIVRFTGRASDGVRGTVFEVTQQELRNADKYEVAAYTRVAVKLGSGIDAWVYVDAGQTAPTT